jgi:hypothetical protein
MVFTTTHDHELVELVSVKYVQWYVPMNLSQTWFFLIDESLSVLLLNPEAALGKQNFVVGRPNNIPLAK